MASVAPSVAAPLENILEVERRLLRPDPYGLLAGLIEQDGERRRAYPPANAGRERQYRCHGAHGELLHPATEPAERAADPLTTWSPTSLFNRRAYGSEI